MNNYLRLGGDVTRIFAILVLLHRLIVVKNAQGVSRKTQVLLLLVCITRYWDYTTTYKSAYDSFFKVFVTTSTLYIVYILSPLSHHPAQSTYRRDDDDEDHLESSSCNAQFWLKTPRLVGACFVLALLFQFLVNNNNNNLFLNVLELLCLFSIFLESIALWPQIAMFRRYRQVESLTGGAFIFLYGIYQVLYIGSWIDSPDHQQSNIWLACGIFKMLLCFGGLFWPSETATTPIAPQLLQFFRTLPCLTLLAVIVGSLAISYLLDVMLLTVYFVVCSFLDLDGLVEWHDIFKDSWPGAVLSLVTIAVLVYFHLRNRQHPPQQQSVDTSTQVESSHVDSTMEDSPLLSPTTSQQFAEYSSSSSPQTRVKEEEKAKPVTPTISPTPMDDEEEVMLGLVDEYLSKSSSSDLLSPAQHNSFKKKLSLTPIVVEEEEEEEEEEETVMLGLVDEYLSQSGTPSSERQLPITPSPEKQLQTPLIVVDDDNDQEEEEEEEEEEELMLGLVDEYLSRGDIPPCSPQQPSLNPQQQRQQQL